MHSVPFVSVPLPSSTHTRDPGRVCCNDQPYPEVVCVCVCARARVCVCVRAPVCVCTCVYRVFVCACVYVDIHVLISV